MNRMDDESAGILDIMMLEELVHLIKELYQSGAVSEQLHLKLQPADILGLMTLEELVHLIKEFYSSGAVYELLHLKVMSVVVRVRIKELEHLILEREQSAAVSYPGNSESEPSDSESTTGDSQGLHSLRSAACGGGSGGAHELPKRSNDRRGWVRLHTALGADRDKMTPSERQRRCDQVAALGYIWPVMQKESISRVEGDGCVENLDEEDTRGCVENLDEDDTRGCVESLNDNYYYTRLEEATDYVYSAQEAYYTAHEDAYQTAHEDADSDEQETDYTEHEDAYHTAYEDSDSDEQDGMERVIPNLELSMNLCMTRSRLCSWIMRTFGTRASGKIWAPKALCRPGGKTKCVPKIHSTLRRTLNTPMTTTLKRKMIRTLTRTTTTLRRMLVTMSLSRRPMVTHQC